jgi:hypothetical protein
MIIRKTNVQCKTRFGITNNSVFVVCCLTFADNELYANALENVFPNGKYDNTQWWAVRKYVPHIVNPQTCGLTRFADLSQMWQFADL